MSNETLAMAAVAVQPVVVLVTVGSEFLSWNRDFFDIKHQTNAVNWNGGVFTPFQV